MNWESEFTNKYKKFFQSQNNPVIKLLQRKKQKGLIIDIQRYKYDYVNKIVNTYIDSIDRDIWKNTIKLYYEQLKNADQIMFIQYKKDKINKKPLMVQCIDKFPSPDLKLILNPHKNNYNIFEEEYENLTPSDKEYIGNWAKKQYIKDISYHDFYTHFVPLRTQKELETSELTCLCSFKDGISMRIKIPEHRHVKFQRGPQPTQPFNNKKVISQDQIKPLINNTDPCPKPDQKTKITVKPDILHHHLLARVLFFSKIFNGKPVHIHIFESKFNKKFPWHNKIQVNNKINKGSQLSQYDHKILSQFLGPKHINTGYTVLAGNNIIIYRLEELEKILVHELIHATNIDKDIMNDKRLKCIFNGHLKYHSFCSQETICGYDSNTSKTCTENDYINEGSILRLAEGYTDTVADLLNTLFYSVEVGREKRWSYDEMLNYYSEILQSEILFAIFQVSKLLLYFNFNDYRDLFKPARYKGKVVTIKDSINRYLKEQYFQDTGMPKGSKTKWTVLSQSTSIFSYFVIRLILLFNIDKLAQEFDKVCNNCKDLIDFWNINNNPEKQKIVRQTILKGIMDPCHAVDITMTLIRHLAPVSIYPSIPDDLDIINEEVYPQTLLDTLRRSLYSIKK